MPKLHYSRATTGEKVAECLLDPADAGLIGGLVSAATQQGAGLLWVHSRADLSGAGFTARPGFHEFRADPCPPGGEELPVLPDEVVLGLLPRTFTGRQEKATVVAFHLGRCHGTLMYKAVVWFFPQHGQAFNPHSYENVCTGTFHGTAH